MDLEKPEREFLDGVKEIKGELEKERRKEDKPDRGEDNDGEEKKREASNEEIRKPTEKDNEIEANAEEKKEEIEEEKMGTGIEAREVEAREMDEENRVKVEEKKENETIEEKRETEIEMETDEKKDKEVEIVEKKEEEKRCLYDLKENEKKALFEFRSKLEESILEGKIFKNNSDTGEQNQEPEGKSEKEENQNLEEKKKLAEEETKKEGKLAEQVTSVEVEKDISLWGVPLLPSKEDEATDTVLLKFLRARDFHVNDALEMLKNTLQWRKESKIDSIADEEDFGEEEFSRFAFMAGKDREGLPVCFNVFGVLGEDGTIEKLMSEEEKKKRFLRWRVQLMEKGIKKLDLRPGGVSTMLQITDLNNTPLPSKKDLRSFIRQAVAVFQDNYPEFVSKNVFINVPFWYYAYTAILSSFLTQRTKSKFVFARPAKTDETLLKYISAEHIPVQYGGLKREDDSEFSVEDTAMEATIKSGCVETIEIPAPEVGRTLMWELSVSGGEVNYREEFVPTDEASYTIIVKRNTKIGVQEGSIRNTFKNSEPGKIVVFIDNSSFKKKRLLYRYKAI